MSKRVECGIILYPLTWFFLIIKKERHGSVGGNFIVAPQSEPDLAIQGWLIICLVVLDWRFIGFSRFLENLIVWVKYTR